MEETKKYMGENARLWTVNQPANEACAAYQMVWGSSEQTVTSNL